jgi:hypothetical protein
LAQLCAQRRPSERGHLGTHLRGHLGSTLRSARRGHLGSTLRCHLGSTLRSTLFSHSRRRGHLGPPLRGHLGTPRHTVPHIMCWEGRHASAPGITSEGPARLCARLASALSAVLRCFSIPGGGAATARLRWAVTASLCYQCCSPPRGGGAVFICETWSGYKPPSVRNHLLTATLGANPPGQ